MKFIGKNIKQLGYQYNFNSPEDGEQNLESDTLLLRIVTSHNKRGKFVPSGSGHGITVCGYKYVCAFDVTIQSIQSIRYKIYDFLILYFLFRADN